MTPMRVLLLGGTTEASMLARRIAGDGRFEATLSLAGATRNPQPAVIARRIGGFGGVDGLRAWLRAERARAVIDATHPYAVQISANAALAARAEAIALLRVERPPWTEQQGDQWTRVADAKAAASRLGGGTQRVLLTVGSKSLEAFRDAAAHHYVVRCIDAPDPRLLPAGAELVLARGPFTLGAELSLLRDRRITLLVSKNSGGGATAAKLLAARRLRLPVLMIDRPPASAGTDTVMTAEAAFRWLEHVRRHDVTGARRGA